MKLYIVAYEKYDSLFDGYETEIVTVFKNENNAERFAEEGISKGYYIIETDSADF